ncbi:MAG: O-antigen ligase family protein, partial [Phycisphaerae bacterium]|nr:O-antigen ligase family protein [Phycisphaerae bacterium]
MLAATFGLLSVAAVRALIMFAPGFGAEFAGAAVGPQTSFGPSAAAVTNSLAMIVLAMAVVDAMRQGRHVHWVLLTCWLAGLPFWFLHAGADAESLRIGGDWAGALALGLAALHLASEAWVRRACLAVAIALIVPLAADGLHQFANHGKTVELYEKERDQFLRSRGWREGSPMQRKYEARLYQFEATGRMSFSNVFGSVMMSLLLLSLGAAASLRSRPAAIRWGLLLVSALAALAVYLSHSKGALIAGMASAAAVAVAWGLSRRLGGGKWIWRSVGPAVLVCGVAAVVLRAAMGAPQAAQGERSLLFRSFYWSAAGRMWQANPVVGVGPGAFRDRYLLTKNPLSPEDVSDPHNVFVSYISTLGVGGIAWAVIPLALLIGAGASVDRRLRVSRAPPEARMGLPLVAAVGGVVFTAQFLVSFHFLGDPAVWGLLGVCLVIIGLGFRVMGEGFRRSAESSARAVGPTDRAVGAGMMVAAVGMCLVMLPPMGMWLGGALGFAAA